jgi:hypothetical protein
MIPAVLHKAPKVRSHMPVLQVSNKHIFLFSPPDSIHVCPYLNLTSRKLYGVNMEDSVRLMMKALPETQNEIV